MPKPPFTFELVPMFSLYSLESQDCEAIQGHFGMYGAGTAQQLFRHQLDDDSGFPEDVHCAIAWVFKHIPDEHKTVIVYI